MNEETNDFESEDGLPWLVHALQNITSSQKQINLAYLCFCCWLNIATKHALGDQNCTTFDSLLYLPLPSIEQHAVLSQNFFWGAFCISSHCIYPLFGLGRYHFLPGGGSVCDGRSTIFSDPPFAFVKKNLVSPRDTTPPHRNDESAQFPILYED